MAIRVPLGAHDTGGEEPERSDQPVSFEELWEHRVALRNLCQRIVGDAATADDVVQETYLRALRNLEKMERRPSLMPWLATVARRRSIDELRRRKYSSPAEFVPDAPTRPEADPGENVSVSDTVARVREALGTLTERERTLLMRQVDHGFSLSELAAEDESSVASVRSVLSRARTKLRDALAEHGAPALAPLGALGAWVKQRLAALNARLQQLAPAMPGGMERFGEMVTASVAALLLTGGGAVPFAPSGAGAVELAAPAARALAGDTGQLDARSAVPGSEGVTGTGASASSVLAPRHEGPIGSLPLDPLAPSNDVQQPEDANIAEVHHRSRPGGSPELFAVGERRGSCTTSCAVLFHSGDGGASWQRLPAKGLNGTRLLVSPGYPADPRLFAVGVGGLTVSRDGGRTFEPVVPTEFGRGPAAMSPGFSAGDDRILIGTVPSWVYDDTTRTARPLATAPVSGSVNQFAFAPDYMETGRLFAGTVEAEQGEFRAVVYSCGYEYGQDVCQRRIPLPGVAEAPSIAVSSGFGTDGTVLAWSGSRLFRSGDGGVTFRPVDLPIAGNVNGATDDGRGAFFLAVHHVTPAASAGGVLVSRDGGRSFVRVGSGTALAAGTRHVAVTPDGRLLAAPVASAGGGILCSTDGGATWSARCPA